MVAPEKEPPSPAAPPLEAPEVDLAFQLDAPESVGDAAIARAPLLISGVEAEAMWSNLMGQWLTALAPELPGSLRAPAYSLGLSLVDDATMAELNRSWRKQAKPTDVLSFAAQEGAPPLLAGLAGADVLNPLELGDIVISLETATRQADEGGQSLAQELLFLATHGLLHLLGWDHPNDTSLAAMLARQDDLLSNTVHPPRVVPDPCDGESTG